MSSSEEIRGCELPHAISLERCPHPHSQSPRSAREPIITVTQPEITHWPFLPNCPNILSAHAPQTLAEEQGPTWLQDPPKSIQNPSPRPQLQCPLVPQGPWGQLSRLHSTHNVHPTWARKKVGVQSCPREPRPEVSYQSIHNLCPCFWAFLPEDKLAPAVAKFAVNTSVPRRTGLRLHSPASPPLCQGPQPCHQSWGPSLLSMEHVMNFLPLKITRAPKNSVHSA